VVDQPGVKGSGLSTHYQIRSPISFTRIVSETGRKLGEPMSDTVSDFVLQRLAEWGIKRVSDYPGDGINGIMGAFDRLADRIEFIQVRHQEMAAFMACAHARFTGQVGVCLATSGPGAIRLLNGLHDAKMDHQPVVAIIGRAARSGIGGDYQQEVDLISLFKDVAVVEEVVEETKEAIENV
jgi:pyruvate dehydrogenase (quinone)